MSVIAENLNGVRSALPEHVTLVAVSKTKPESAVLEAYEAGQRIFGENKVQELVRKQETLPSDIEWHMIGHLQRNKVKQIAPFVSLIHGVDSLRLLQEIDKQGAKCDRIIPCLLQIHIAEESTKFGLDEAELDSLLNSEEFRSMKNVEVRGLMGMATYTVNTDQIKLEFEGLKTLFDQTIANGTLSPEGFNCVSMGMSGDYKTAIEAGSTMIRVGSSIFGVRSYQ